MRILLIQCVYNELKLLPWKMKWAQENGLEVFTYDNFSTDGSYEWLTENGHDCALIDTDGMFSLRRNNFWTLRKFHEEQPDWCVIAGCDMFYRVSNFSTLRAFIEYVDRMGLDLVDCSRIFNFYYTGVEDDDKDPRGEYFFYEERNDWDIHLIAKYREKLNIEGDKFVLGDTRPFRYPNLACLHYWFRSNARERFMEKLERRERAWREGVDYRIHGSHYPGIVEQDKWVRDPAGLRDIRETPFAWEE